MSGMNVNKVKENKNFPIFLLFLYLMDDITETVRTKWDIYVVLFIYKRKKKSTELRK